MTWHEILWASTYWNVSGRTVLFLHKHIRIKSNSKYVLVLLACWIHIVTPCLLKMLKSSTEVVLISTINTSSINIVN
jgi:hypothetical protein